MNIEQAVIENLRKLPLEKQQEVLDFSQFLTLKHSQRTTGLKIPSSNSNLMSESMTPHEKAEDWLNFLESQPLDTPGLPDEALHRDTIYD